jgi:hypothetical protein
MTRRLLAALGVTALAFVLAAQAADPPVKVSKPSDKSSPMPDLTPEKIALEQSEAAQKQTMLQRQFDDFKQSLLRLAHRLESSTKQEDKDRAALLKEAIKVASEAGVETKFSALINKLRAGDTFKDLDQLDDLMNRNQDLRKDLRALIELLLRDDRDSQLREERLRTERLLERIKELIAKQERVRAQTDLGRKDAPALKRDQERVTEATRDLIARKDGKGNKGGEAKKGDAKSGGKEGKDHNKAESKPDTKGSKGDNRDAKPAAESKEGKPGEGKEGKEGKDSKSGEGKEGKPGEGKEGKPGEGKEGKEAKEGKPGEGKEGKEGKPGEGKEAKPGQPKDSKNGEGKPSGKPSDAKAGQGKTGESKDAKPGEGSGKEGKPSDGKPQSKESDSKGKGDGKGEAKPSSGKPSDSTKPSESKPSQSGQQGQSGQPKPGQSGQQGQSGQKSPPSDPNADNPIVKKQIQETNKYQKYAEDNISKNENKKASGNQDDAIKELEKLKKKLEDLLKQLREEEIERLLAQLEGRCRHMLALQIIVRDGTVNVNDKIKGRQLSDEERRASEQESNILSEKEEEIVREANLAIRLIEAEGSAIAFAEVFKQVRTDMITVANRLRKTDVGDVTIGIENDIIATLGEMVEALKKARQDNKNPPPPPKGGSGPPPDPRLIDLIAELKMIRSMQERVNKRTETYGKEYKTEQLPPPESVADAKEREKLEMIKGELKDLAQREEKISKVTSDIYKGKNKAN